MITLMRSLHGLNGIREALQLAFKAFESDQISAFSGKRFVFAGVTLW